MKSHREWERGLVKAIILIVVALIILGFFGYNLRAIIEGPAVSDNLAYAWGLAVKFWDIVWNAMQKIFNRG